MLVEPEEGSVYMAACNAPVLPAEHAAAQLPDPESSSVAVASDKAPREQAASKWAVGVFRGLFHDELAAKLESNPDAFKTAKAQPEPLHLESMMAEGRGDLVGQGGVSGVDDAETGLHALRVADGISWAGICQRLPSAQECASKFIACSARMALQRLPSFGGLTFDKDDGLAMEWVTATANLRALSFKIGVTSPWDAKSIAGNIIPAIATTNAIVAGLETSIAMRLIASELDGALHEGAGTLARVSTASSAEGVHVAVAKVLSSVGTCVRPGTCRGPRESCFVCGSNEALLRLDTGSRTLRFLVHDVLMKRMGFVAPLVDNNDSFSFLEEREEDEDDDEYEQKMGFMDVTLDALVGGGIKGGTVLSVTDMRQDLTVRIFVRQATAAELNPGEGEDAGASHAGAGAARGSEGAEGEEPEDEVLFVLDSMGGGKSKSTSSQGTGDGSASEGVEGGGGGIGGGRGGGVPLAGSKRPAPQGEGIDGVSGNEGRSSDSSSDAQT